MPWTNSDSLTELISGPFKVGIGADGSEISVGDIAEMELTQETIIADVTGGNQYGTETRVDGVITGFNVTATFVLMQNIGNTNMMEDTMPFATIGVGAVTKNLTYDIDTICGQLLSAKTALIRFHYQGTAAVTTKTNDLIFKKAVIVHDGSFTMNAETIMWPCKMYALPDSDGKVMEVSVEAS